MQRQYKEFTMSKTIGQTIVSKRESKGLTTAELAAKCKVSGGFLSHVEKDHCTISDDLYGALQKHLGLTVSRAALTAHNESATQWMREYRADLKAKKAAQKAARTAPVSSANPQLPGFTNDMDVRINELVSALIIERLQQRLSAQSSAPAAPVAPTAPAAPAAPVFSAEPVFSEDVEVIPVFTETSPTRRTRRQA
jgi:transcriptional regulator with XRE-family HTH domain